jgi:hypothetical protein
MMRRLDRHDTGGAPVVNNGPAAQIGNTERAPVTIAAAVINGDVGGGTGRFTKHAADHKLTVNEVKAIQAAYQQRESEFKALMNAKGVSEIFEEIAKADRERRDLDNDGEPSAAVVLAPSPPARREEERAPYEPAPQRGLPEPRFSGSGASGTLNGNGTAVRGFYIGPGAGGGSGGTAGTSNGTAGAGDGSGGASGAGGGTAGAGDGSGGASGAGGGTGTRIIDGFTIPNLDMTSTTLPNGLPISHHNIAQPPTNAVATFKIIFTQGAQYFHMDQAQLDNLIEVAKDFRNENWKVPSTYFATAATTIINDIFGTGGNLQLGKSEIVAMYNIFAGDPTNAPSDKIAKASLTRIAMLLTFDAYNPSSQYQKAITTLATINASDPKNCVPALVEYATVRSREQLRATSHVQSRSSVPRPPTTASSTTPTIRRAPQQLKQRKPSLVVSDGKPKTGEDVRRALAFLSNF